MSFEQIMQKHKEPGKHCFGHLLLCNNLKVSDLKQLSYLLIVLLS